MPSPCSNARLITVYFNGISDKVLTVFTGISLTMVSHKHSHKKKTTILSWLEKSYLVPSMCMKTLWVTSHHNFLWLNIDHSLNTLN